MYKIPLGNLNESPKTNPIRQASYSGFIDTSARKKLKEKSGTTQNRRSIPFCKFTKFMLDFGSFAENITRGPAFYAGRFNVVKDQIKDTFLSLNGWGKGIAIVNGFNVGRFWPVNHT